MGPSRLLLALFLGFSSTVDRHGGAEGLAGSVPIARLRHGIGNPEAGSVSRRQPGRPLPLASPTKATAMARKVAALVSEGRTARPGSSPLRGRAGAGPGAVSLGQVRSPEDGEILVLPNGTDIVKDMCDVEQQIFVLQKPHNISCLTYVSDVEGAYRLCNNETNVSAPEDVPFPACFGKHMPQTPVEEICKELVNVTDVEIGGFGGPAYERCFLDASMVERCLTQCTTKDTKYQFSECLGNCYSMNLTARLVKPTGPPTTPPIPEHLIPFYKTLYNVTAHLDGAVMNFTSASDHAAKANDFLRANLSNWWNTTTTTAQPLSQGEWNALHRLTQKLLPYENFLQLRQKLRSWVPFSF